MQPKHATEPTQLTVLTSALPCPQRAHNKVQRLLDKADKLTDELDAERKLTERPVRLRLVGEDGRALRPPVEAAAVDT